MFRRQLGNHTKNLVIRPSITLSGDKVIDGRADGLHAKAFTIFNVMEGERDAMAAWNAGSCGGLGKPRLEGDRVSTRQLLVFH